MKYEIAFLVQLLKAARVWTVESSRQELPQKKIQKHLIDDGTCLKLSIDFRNCSFSIEYSGCVSIHIIKS